jgi:undecaprenyl-diphosphatase
VLAKPNATAAVLAINGLVLLAVERWRRSSGQAAGGHRADGAGPPDGQDREIDERTAGVAVDAELATLPLGRAVLIGAAQIVALAPGFSRSGITMSAGLVRGLNHEQAARFAFLLATPVILAAGALKIPDLMGPLGSGIRGQVLFGSVLSFVGAFVSVRFLTKYFRTKSMRPFAVYCVLAGVAAGIYLNV